MTPAARTRPCPVFCSFLDKVSDKRAWFRPYSQRAGVATRISLGKAAAAKHQPNGGHMRTANGPRCRSSLLSRATETCCDVYSTNRKMKPTGLHVLQS